MAVTIYWNYVSFYSRHVCIHADHVIIVHGSRGAAVFPGLSRLQWMAETNNRWICGGPQNTSSRLRRMMNLGMCVVGRFATGMRSFSLPIVPWKIAEEKFRWKEFDSPNPLRSSFLSQWSRSLAATHSGSKGYYTWHDIITVGTFRRCQK